jgi:biofilm PGA synthesis N-glycosyltransferase PgaC
MTIASILRWAADTPIYHVALAFVAVYPIVTAVMWTITSLIFFRRNERDSAPALDGELPFVSIVVPAYCEATVIEGTLDALLSLDYPHYEIVVVDDASPDQTAEIVRLHLTPHGRVRLLAKRVNEGKAMALNDAIPITRGEIVVIVDADIRPHRDVLRHMVGHFRDGRVAAVAGNPQVDNTRTLLAKVQATEFASIVSVLRRAQRVWGRILTVSGALCAFRKSALVDVGLFDPDKVTEDIAMSWKLQRRFYDIRYEPRAVCAMQVPETFRALWKQRTRWARGLAQVLRTHRDLPLDWRGRRLWPVFIEAVCSVLWAYTTVTLVAFWALSYAAGLAPLGASPIPNFWGMVIATLSLVQLAVGVWLDRHYNRGVGRFYLWAAIYPMFYWGLMLVVTVVSTPAALFRRRQATSHWHTARIPIREEASVVASAEFADAA